MNRIDFSPPRQHPKNPPVLVLCTEKHHQMQNVVVVPGGAPRRLRRSDARSSASFIRARGRTVGGPVTMVALATRARAVSVKATRRRRTDGAVKMKMGRMSTSTKSFDEERVSDETSTSRRAMLGGKVAFVFGEAIAFPWLTESATRPKAPGDAALRPLSAAWVRSLLPAERDLETMREANEALEKGERALSEGDAGRAIEELSKIETLVPREYKLNQRAGLALSEAHKLAGNNNEYLEYKNRVWWWGRGLRWPGWYIIAYLSARSAYFDAKDDDDATFTMQEAGILVVLWIGLLFLLVEYGLPDYQI